MQFIYFKHWTNYIPATNIIHSPVTKLPSPERRRNENNNISSYKQHWNLPLRILVHFQISPHTWPQGIPFTYTNKLLPSIVIKFIFGDSFFLFPPSK